MDEICSLQSSCNFDERVLSIFLRKKFVPRGQSTVKNKERGWGGAVKITSPCPSPPPTSTVHSNSKSNMAGQINNYELIKLACCYKMPALQAMRFVETEWLGCWTCSLVILGSGSLLCYSMNFFSVFSILCALNSLAAFCTNPIDLLSASCSF